MATTGFIYDTEDGTCLARVTHGGEVLDANIDGRQIGTVDPAGNMFDLNGALVGHIRAEGQFDGGNPEAFRKLLRKGNDSCSAPTDRPAHIVTGTRASSLPPSPSSGQRGSSADN